jgi:hypothetical protein
MIARGDRRLHAAAAGAGLVGSGPAVAFGGILEGSHPVSIPYPVDGMPSAYRNLASGARVGFGQYVGDPTRLGILLYRDNGDGTVSAVTKRDVAGSYGIECSSCHDVHNGPTVRDRYLVRGKLSGRGPEFICLKCHTM